VPATAGVAVELGNLQGLVHERYPCPLSRYLLFRLTGGDGRRFVRKLLPLVTVARANVSPGQRLLNLGISFDGLRALGIAEEVLAEFPLDFSNGPSPGVLGDFGTSAPEHWWHRRFPTTDIHVLVQLAAHTDEDLMTATEGVRATAAQTGVIELSATPHEGETIDGCLLGKGRLHFGYRDGISQPTVAWSDDVKDSDHVNFRHFVLGYSTPDISSSPKVVGSRPTSSKQATDLVRDGSYAVFKWIYQDVATFNRFLETEGPKFAPDRPAAEAQELLAAKLMGRWRDGTPLVLSPGSASADLASRNDFSYSALDPQGARCPFAAHIRVVNPRDQPLNAAEFGFVPRVIRRGTPFGPPLDGTTDDGQLRGLVGMFLCASISAQIYKLTAWMKRTDFSPAFTNSAGQDPLANRDCPGASATFEIATETGKRTITLTRFTRTLGTAFFLIPGLSGLRLIAHEMK
jgi:Dyp-type peroxidase family